MAIAVFRVQVISRGKGRNIIAAAAYRAGQKLQSTDDNLTKNYTKKAHEIEAENILLPANAPKEYQDRQKLWQAVEQIEKQKNSQLAREFMIPLPREMSKSERIHFIEEYCKSQFVSQGMCVDYAIHDKGDGNPHAHILVTMRGIDEQGKWECKEKKVYKLDDNGNKIPVIDPETGEQKIGARGRKIWERELVEVHNWNNQENVEKWRNACEEQINKYLPEEKQISYKSYERQGIDRIAQYHEGQKVTSIERKAEAEGKEIQTEVRKANIAIQQENIILAEKQKEQEEQEQAQLQSEVEYSKQEKLQQEQAQLQIQIAKTEGRILLAVKEQEKQEKKLLKLQEHQEEHSIKSKFDGTEQAITATEKKLKNIEEQIYQEEKTQTKLIKEVKQIDEDIRKLDRQDKLYELEQKRREEKIAVEKSLEAKQQISDIKPKPEQEIENRLKTRAEELQSQAQIISHEQPCKRMETQEEKRKLQQELEETQRRLQERAEELRKAQERAKNTKARKPDKKIIGNTIKSNDGRGI